MNDTSSTATDNLSSHLGQAGTHFQEAAVHAGETIKAVGSRDSEEMRLGKANMVSALAEGALSGIAAVERTGAASREQLDALMDKGRNVIEDVSELIRERPLSALGMATAAGWIIARLGSMGSPNK
jgi:ElaB/YqjD/DUF883 family membrane-anchored ribosome-binding protein